MKIWNRKSLLCAAVALAALFALAGCQKAVPQVNGPEFPLEDQVLTDTLEQAGLDWVVDQEETQSSSEGSILHSLRSPDKPYPQGSPDSRLLYAGVTSSMIEGERYLYTFFTPESVPGFQWEESRPFAWADWEGQFQLAALLFGFEDKNEIYEAVCKEELAEDYLLWEKQLTGGYCRVLVFHTDRTSLPGDSYTVAITIYESKDLCEELDARAEENRQKMEEMFGSSSSAG